jgi:hypothetical protein
VQVINAKKHSDNSIMEDVQSKWYELINKAQNLLLKGQEIDNYESNIQIAIEPSFENSIFLQLVIVEDKVQWFRTTWLRLSDSQKFTPIENLRYIGKNIEPTIKYESGVINKRTIDDILSFIETISIKPKIEKWGGIILDGIYYTVTIGVENTRSTHKWHYQPDNWEDLQILASMLQKLNESL